MCHYTAVAMPTTRDSLSRQRYYTPVLSELPSSHPEPSQCLAQSWFLAPSGTVCMKNPPTAAIPSGDGGVVRSQTARVQNVGQLCTAVARPGAIGFGGGLVVEDAATACQLVSLTGQGHDSDIGFRVLCCLEKHRHEQLGQQSVAHVGTLMIPALLSRISSLCSFCLKESAAALTDSKSDRSKDRNSTLASGTWLLMSSIADLALDSVRAARVVSIWLVFMPEVEGRMRTSCHNNDLAGKIGNVLFGVEGLAAEETEHDAYSIYSFADYPKGTISEDHGSVETG
ncbi:hypothetical protein KCU93_g63, partial [Aureobasidium melanogenum]